MAKRYRPVDRDQAFLLPPDMREWLPAGHPVWLVIGVVDQHLDTSAFHALRRTGGAGAAGYDSDMMVTLLIWAYANGVTSSRRIEALCRTDVAFRVICAGHAPDHVTIARFRAGSGGPVESLFTGVLVLCARLGMGGLGGGGAGWHQGRRERVEGGEPDRGGAAEAGRGAGRGACGHRCGGR